MSLYGTNMDFRTLNNLEYTPKKGSVLPYSPPHDSNPVSSPWRQYLVPDESLKHLLPADGEYEDPTCVLHRARIKEMPDFKFLKQLYSHAEQTVYQKDFCKAAKEREILRVRTGDSDYMAGIGALGDFILKEKLHGEIKPSGISVWEIKRRMALLDQGISPGEHISA